MLSKKQVLLQRSDFNVSISYLLNNEMRKSVMPVYAFTSGLALVYANKKVRDDHPNAEIVRAVVENITLLDTIRPKLVM